jgi:hypothetical protein
MLRDTGIWTLGSTVIRCTLLLLPHTPCVIAVAGRRKERREEGLREHRAGSQGASGGGSSRTGSTGRRSRERRAERREQDAGGRGT